MATTPSLPHRKHTRSKPARQPAVIALLLGLVIFTLPAPVQAQTPTIRFERISLEQGLSHGTVFSIVQDQTGFMWFGTQSGLNRYDGYNITVYKHNPADPHSISNDNAGNLYIDRSGIIWIGTWGGGLNRLDPRTGQFTAFTHNPDNPNSLSSNRVQTIFEDSAGNLWVGTSGGGLNRFNRQTQTFTRFQNNPANPNSISNNRIWRITEDAAGMLWVATSDGLNRFDPRAQTFTRFQNNPANPNSLVDNLVRTLYIDSSGILWAGTENGLDRFDPATETFTHFQHNPANPTSLGDNIINALLEDSSGNFWVGTSRGGLNKLNRDTGAFTRYVNDPRNPNSLSYNDVRWILEDRSGVLWVATRGGGVNKFVPTSEKFTYMAFDPNNPNSLNNNDVRAIYQDREGMLWIGTKGGGLNRYNPHTGAFTVYRHNPDNPNSLGHNDVYAIYQDHTGVLWLGLSGGGLNRFDPQTETFTRFESNPDNPNSLSSNDINTIFEDTAGMLWIGTKGGGLNRFNPATGQFTRYQFNPNDPTSLGNNDVYAIYQDRAGALWVGTYGGGLNQLDPQTGRFVRYRYNPNNPASLSNNDVYAVHQSRDGVFWIGTANGGLNKFNPATGEFTRFGQEDGLQSEVIYGILEDEEGNLWLSTGKGLSKFNPRTGQFISYDFSDGLESVGYHEGAYYRSSTGEMFFGGINGLIRFYPGDIKDNPHPPPVVLTAMTRPNQPPLTASMLGQSGQVELSYRDDVFSFEFAALDYTNPAKNRYAYMLEGFDKEWIEAGNRHFATYTNLDPGEYTFRVKGSNNAGVWNETGVSIKLVVTPPFWETWWFRIIAVAVAMGVALTAYKLRVRTIKAQRERLRALVAERTAELVSANQELQTLTTRLQSELALAREIEQNLLPPPRPNWPNLDALCYSVPAQEVGGDFYAYHAFTPADGARFAIAVGDASGKGMPAALLMAVSLASFQSAVTQTLGPAKLLAHLDEAIQPYTRTGRQNCSFCYAEIAPAAGHNGDSRVLRVANAGCVSPLIRRQNGAVEWVDIGGMPLGVGLGAEDGYREATLPLAAGDLVILTSDGVVEAMTPTGKIFGFERLEQAVANGPAGSAAEMVAHLRREVAAFTRGAEPHDDLTIVVVQV